MKQHHQSQGARTLNQMIQIVSALLAILVTFFAFPFLQETSAPYILGFVRTYYAYIFGGYEWMIWWLWAGFVAFGCFYAAFTFISAKLTVLSVKWLKRSFE